MNINNCIGVILINISHTSKKIKDHEKIFIKYRKYCKNVKSKTKIMKHKKINLQNYYEKYQAESTD